MPRATHVQRQDVQYRNKIEWIKEYIRTSGSHVDILNAQFVDAYITEFNPLHAIQYFGANTCPDLGRILSKGFRMGDLSRSTIGLPNMQPGYPKWVYVYSIQEY